MLNLWRSLPLHSGLTKRNLELRIAVHDYAGHPFQLELTRELAKRGHEARHFFYAGEGGPKGAFNVVPSDPPLFTIQPIKIDGDYDKRDFFRRWRMDVRYGFAAARQILEFRPDVVISGNTPLDAQRQLLHQLKAAHIPFAFWMQDFFSLAVKRLVGRRFLGLGRLVAFYYQRLELKLLRSSDAIILISEDFIQPLQALGVSTKGVTVIPNWGAIGSIPVRPKINSWSTSVGLSDRFVFLYSGTLALKHNPELLWRLAEEFESDPEVLIVVAAAGVSVDQLKERNILDPKPNLKFLPLQRIEDFPNMLGSADVVLALLESDAGEFSVPSKILSYLCAGRPIILSSPKNNRAARIVAEAQAGLVVAAGDAKAFCEAAKQFRSDREAMNACGLRGRSYAETEFNLANIASAFEGVVGAIVLSSPEKADGV